MSTMCHLSFQEERRKQEKGIKRKDIIHAAERVFFSKGHENASMDEEAKEAEFNKRTVCVYFSSKEQIYFEIRIRGYRLLNKMIEKRSRRAALHFFTFLGFSEEYPEYFKAIMEYETKDPDGQSSIEGEPKAEC